MNDPVRVGVSSVLSRSPSSAWGAWVWNLGVPAKDRGLDTLLSFEESGTRSSWQQVIGGLFFWAFQDWITVGVMAWVGVVFVNWIVDASIFAVGLTSPAAIFDAIISPGFQTPWVVRSQQCVGHGGVESL